MLSKTDRIWLEWVLLLTLVLHKSARVQDTLSIQLTDAFSTLSEEICALCVPPFWCCWKVQLCADLSYSGSPRSHVTSASPLD